MAAPTDLAFKAYEIEELVDVHFFRRVGHVVARLARRVGMSANVLTMLGGAEGVAAGLLLYDPRLGGVAFAGLLLYGVMDSADGQLARMTGQSSAMGRTLDGISGWATNVAVFVAILAGSLAVGHDRSVIWWAMAAGLSAAVHAQLYDYHRTTYARVVVSGLAEATWSAAGGRRWDRRLLGGYEALQRRLAGRHHDVERAIAARAAGGSVRPEDRRRYREAFRPTVRGWNVMGDNVRRFAVGACVLVGHLPWFFVFVAVPLNVLLVGLWLWQAKVDARFLAFDHERERA